MLWPTSALLTWGLGWFLWRLVEPPFGAAAALLVCSVSAWAHRRPMRRWITLAGLPLALLAHGVAWPAWMWLLLLLVGLALYPPSRWSEAPLFLTPARALEGLAQRLVLPVGRRILDAGCGTGAALQALHREFPDACLAGTEASALLAAWARWRCPWAVIRRGDLWAEDWSGVDLVYVFLRPETMAKILLKARAELRPGAYLLSLDFPLPEVQPHARWPVGDVHQLYLYCAEELN